MAKLLGVIALLAPRIPVAVREWAYAGFGITLIVATISHGVLGDPAGRLVAPLIALLLLASARMLWPRTVPAS